LEDPVLGNGSLIGRYHTVGRRRFVDLTLVPGTTTTFGLGYWIFPLPGIASNTANAVTYTGTIWMLDSVTGLQRVGVAYALPGVSQIFMVTHGVNMFVGATSPHAWVYGDKLSLSLSFDL
jgi:hypothetical protein